MAAQPSHGPADGEAVSVCMIVRHPPKGNKLYPNGRNHVHIVIVGLIGDNATMTLRVLTIFLLSLWLPSVPVFALEPVPTLEIDAAAEAQRQAAGLARLCGLWDWTVHSHSRNHREARSKIVLPSSQAAGLEGPSPTEIRIYGDAVYFRWDFPGGYQEDSMLFIEDRRLEGTFRMSNGAVGAINGKRVSACPSTGSGSGGAERTP